VWQLLVFRPEPADRPDSSRGAANPDPAGRSPRVSLLVRCRTPLSESAQSRCADLVRTRCHEALEPTTSTGTAVGHDRCACRGLLRSGRKGAVNVKRSPAPGMPARGIVSASPRTTSPKRDPGVCEPLSTSSPTVILGPPRAVGHFDRIPRVASTPRLALSTGAHGALVAHDERAEVGTDDPLRPRRRPPFLHGDPDLATRGANPGTKTAGGER
jgi:hypothetical protein